MSSLQESVELNPGTDSLIVVPELSPLGDFSKLSRKIRSIIWQFLRPELRTVSDPRNGIASQGSLPSDELSPNEGGRLGIMRTSRQLYIEISTGLYKRDLVFIVHTNPYSWSVKDLPGAVLEDFYFITFSRFRKIEFELEPPGSSSRMQLLQVQNQIVEIVNCIEYYQDGTNLLSAPWGSHLPEVNIFFVRTDTADWFSDKEPNACSPNFARSDVGLVLCPFEVLRKVARVFLDIPFPLDMYDEAWVHLIIELMAVGTLLPHDLKKLPHKQSLILTTPQAPLNSPSTSRRSNFGRLFS